MSMPDERLGNAVLLENDYVRVWHHWVAVGKTGHLHLHRRPYLSVVIGGGQGKTVETGGNVLQEFQLGPGQVYWYGPEDLPEAHALRNTGAHPIVIVTIEFLKSSVLRETVDGER